MSGKELLIMPRFHSLKVSIANRTERRPQGRRGLTARQIDVIAAVFLMLVIMGQCYY
jgi:hypothetical protein